MVWDYEDTPRLVGQLSPPASAKEAERVLRRIHDALARELHRERHESQLTGEVREELTALRNALDGLKPRANNVLCDALGDRLFLPFPYEQAQAVINPCRPGIPAISASPAVRLRAVRMALDIALDGLSELPRGAPGTISPATKRAVVVLCRVYCRVHGAPRPTWNPHTRTIGNPAAIDFAWLCLSAWGAPIGRLQPADVIRTLKLRQQFGLESTE